MKVNGKLKNEAMKPYAMDLFKHGRVYSLKEIADACAEVDPSLKKSRVAYLLSTSKKWDWVGPWRRPTSSDSRHFVKEGTNKYKLVGEASPNHQKIASLEKEIEALKKENAEIKKKYANLYNKVYFIGLSL